MLDPEQEPNETYSEQMRRYEAETDAENEPDYDDNRPDLDDEDEGDEECPNCGEFSLNDSGECSSCGYDVDEEDFE